MKFANSLETVPSSNFVLAAHSFLTLLTGSSVSEHRHEIRYHPPWLVRKTLKNIAPIRKSESGNLPMQIEYNQKAI